MYQTNASGAKSFFGMLSETWTSWPSRVPSQNAMPSFSSWKKRGPARAMFSSSFGSVVRNAKWKKSRPVARTGK